VGEQVAGDAAASHRGIQAPQPFAALRQIAAASADRDTAVPRSLRPFRVDLLPARITFDQAWNLRPPGAAASPPSAATARKCANVLRVISGMGMPRVFEKNVPWRKIVRINS